MVCCFYFVAVNACTATGRLYGCARMGYVTCEACHCWYSNHSVALHGTTYCDEQLNLGPGKVKLDRRLGTQVESGGQYKN